MERFRSKAMFTGIGLAVGVLIGLAGARGKAKTDAEASAPVSSVSSRAGEPLSVPVQVQSRPVQSLNTAAGAGESASSDQPDTPRARLMRKYASLAEHSGRQIVEAVREHFRNDKELDPELSSRARDAFQRYRTEKLADAPVIEQLCGTAGCLFIYALVKAEQVSAASLPASVQWPSETLQVLPYDAGSVKYGAIVLLAPSSSAASRDLGSKVPD